MNSPDRSASSTSKVVQAIWDTYREELGTVPPDLKLALRSAFDRNCVDEFRNVWGGAEAGVLRSCQRPGGPVSSGLQAFIGRGTLQIRRRRLGSRAAGCSGSCKLKRVGQDNEVDVSWAQFLSTLLLLLCCFSGVVLSLSLMY